MGIIVPFIRCRGALSLLLLATSPALAQTPWRSTLYPMDWTPPANLSFESDKLIQDFSYAGYRRGEADIPEILAPVFDATTYGADPTGAADSTVALQAAIDAAAAAGGGVVVLPAGTFKVSPRGANTYALRIAASRIVLRGAGRDRTFLFNDSFMMRGKDIIRVEGSTSGWGTVPAGSPLPRLSEDLLRPTVTIPVTSTAGLAVGDWIMLRADATDAFVAEHNMTDLWAGLSLGGVMFQRQIVAIDAAASRLTIDAPIRYYLKMRDNARLHRAVPHVEEVGLEDFSIGNRQHASAAAATGWGEEDYDTQGNGSYDVHGSSAISLVRARDCWVSGVATYRPAANTLDTHLLSNGIALLNCRGVTVRRCEFQRPLFGGGGGNGYMYRLNNSNECLVRDSIARHHRHGFVFSHMACSGNVIHGGLGQHTKVQAAGTGVTNGEGSDHHMQLSQSNLIDGVQLDRDFFDAYYRGSFGAPSFHGQTAVHSVFWNLVGLAYQSNKTYIVRSEQARYGYIIGTRGPAGGLTNTTSTPISRTAPLDHTEGAGIGAALQPLSLYQDQLIRRLGRTPAPPAPTALAAVNGLTAVALNWFQSTSATAYQVRRASAEAGPFTLLATISGASFTDTHVGSGAASYYTVSALNPAGESVPSLTIAAAPVSAYRQDSGAEGLVVAEVERFDAHVPQGGHSWAPNSTAGFSGDGALAASPNNGITRESGFTANSPRVDFRVEFVRAGVHHVWIRGLGLSGTDDSMHAGLNGAVVDTSDRISGFGPNWAWTRNTADGPTATINIPAPGLHTINLWMREDGLIIDKLVLTTNAAYTPTDLGPAASSRVGGGSVLAATESPNLVNLATRTQVGGDAGTPTAGFVLGGTGTKRLLLRAVGPALAAFGLPGALPDPSVAVVANGTTLVSNDTWNAADAPVFSSVGAFALPAGSRDAAVVLSLSAGAYTTPLGAAGGSGVALLEIYDAEPGNTAAGLVNASTRAFVGTGDAVLIPGFTLSGTGTTRVLIRAIGPTLGGFGVANVLADPQLTLFAGATPLGGNDNWSVSGNAGELATVAGQVGAFALSRGSRDAVLLVALPAGSYTVSVSGVAAATGAAIVELYVVR